VQFSSTDVLVLTAICAIEKEGVKPAQLFSLTFFSSPAVFALFVPSSSQRSQIFTVAKSIAGHIRQLRLATIAWELSMAIVQLNNSSKHAKWFTLFHPFPMLDVYQSHRIITKISILCTYLIHSWGMGVMQQCQTSWHWQD